MEVFSSVFMCLVNSVYAICEQCAVVTCEQCVPMHRFCISVEFLFEYCMRDLHLFPWNYG